ncbi:MAG TPA: hypothetical protein VHL80_12620, partial [Polyangia bacterium]|nr:hypothetical protein [Polyangia bacterium]
MQKPLAKPSRIALGITLLGALTLGGLGCGGGTSHPKDAGRDGKGDGSAGATGVAGNDGGAGAAGSTAGTDGGAGA